MSQLRKLELDKALVLFNRLLTKYPHQISLIEQIYQLEIRRENDLGLMAIAGHIFSQELRSADFHQVTLKAYQDLKLRPSAMPSMDDLTTEQVYNLFFHLAQTGYKEDTERLKELIKSKLSEDRRTPKALMLYCEQLIAQGKLLKAEKELEFLLIYYAEAKIQIIAEKQLKQIRTKMSS